MYATLADSIVHMGQSIPWAAIGRIVRLVTLVHKYQPPAQLEPASILLGFHRLRLHEPDLRQVATIVVPLTSTYIMISGIAT